MTTYTVTNLNDTGAGSLRQAILDANANPGADTIVFQAGLTGTITRGAADMAISEALTITGPGADKLTLDAAGQSRIFTVFDGAPTEAFVRITGLTLTNGSGANAGSLIFSAENLSLDRVALTNSTTTNTGGAVHSTGTLSLSNSTISGNTAGGEGGGVESTGIAAISNTTFSGNTSNTTGGAIAGGTSLIISNSTFVNNTATTDGGAIASNVVGATVSNSVFAGNVGGGGGNDIKVFAGGLTVTYSLLKDGTAGATLGAGVIAGGAAAAYTPGPLTLVGGLGVYIPTAGSLVVDAGTPGFVPPPVTDELGLARVSGGRIDMGAVELQQAVVVAPSATDATPPAPPPSKAPLVNADFSNLLRYQTFGTFPPLPTTVTTPTGQVLPNPLLEQQKLIAGIIAKVDAGSLTLQGALDQIVDMADGTTSVATLSYQFFTGHLPTKDGLDYLVSSPLNPTDLNDGFYAGMSLENRYINFAVNLGKVGEGRATFITGYGSLSLNDATAKAYAEIFGAAPDAAKLAAILTPERTSYFLSLGGDVLGQKAAMVGFLLAEAAKSDLGPYAVMNENFLYDLADGNAAYGADLHIYANAGPRYVGLIGQV